MAEVKWKTAKEIEEEKNKPQPPSQEKRIAELELHNKALQDENLANMLAMVDMYEAGIKLQEENTATMLAVTELYETILGGTV